MKTVHVLRTSSDTRGRPLKAGKTYSLPDALADQLVREGKARSLEPKPVERAVRQPAEKRAGKVVRESVKSGTRSRGGAR